MRQLAWVVMFAAACGDKRANDAQDSTVRSRSPAAAALQPGCDLGDRMSCNQVNMVKR